MLEETNDWLQLNLQKHSNLNHTQSAAMCKEICDNATQRKTNLFLPQN